MGVGTRILFELARLAPGLSEAELRLLLQLATMVGAGEDAAAGDQWISCSSRRLAELAGLARSNVVTALSRLRRRGVLAVREGTASDPAAYRLAFLRRPAGGGPVAGPPSPDLFGVGGPVAGPPLDLLQDHPGPITGPPPPLFSGVGGPVAGPPPTENQQLTDGSEIAFAGAPGARIDRVPKELLKEKILDRVLNSTPDGFDLLELEELAGWLQHVMGKNGPRHSPHRPDLRVTAQVLAVAPLTALVGVLRQLLDANTRVGAQYGWFVTVALDRIHGIRAEELVARRAALKLVGRRGKPVLPAAPEAAEIFDALVPPRGGGESSADFVSEIRTALRRKVGA
jgi:hypothetical protein